MEPGGGAAQLQQGAVQQQGAGERAPAQVRCVCSNKVLTLPLCSSVLTLVTSWPPSSPGHQLSFTISPGDLPGEEFSVR